MRPEMSCDASSPPEVVRASQPDTLIHPVIQEARGTQRFGVMTATQWYLRIHQILSMKFLADTYCPPAVGYADRNSANEAASARLQIPAVSSPQITLVDPPEGSASPSDDESAVHEFRIAKASPNMDRRLKLRLSSPLWPSAWSWASSSSCRSFPILTLSSNTAGQE
jgi:hypothetical protein